MGRDGRARARWLAAAAAILTLGLVIRAVAAVGPAQYAGTALYASLIYTGLFVLRPSLAPVPAGALAVAFCWLVEFSQLTGVPAAWSARSVVARLVLGAQFDRTDLAWYPVGVVPLVVLHLILRRRAAAGAATPGPGSRAVRPRG